MADELSEEEEILTKQIEELDATTRQLADKFEALAGMQCSFGECVFDPEMDDLQNKLAEVQRRKSLLEGMIEHLESCAK